MVAADAPLAAWLLIAVQVLGLASAWLARLSEGSRPQVLCQCLFFCAMTLVGGATLVSLRLGPLLWLPCGFTLSLMVLGATCDFSQSRRAAT